MSFFQSNIDTSVIVKSRLKCLLRRLLHYVLFYYIYCRLVFDGVSQVLVGHFFCNAQAAHFPDFCFLMLLNNAIAAHPKIIAPIITLMRIVVILNTPHTNKFPIA